MKTIFSALLFLMMVNFLHGQELVLTNGEQTKKFNFKEHFELKVRPHQISGDQNCCGYIVLNGQIEAVTKDSLLINVESFESHIKVDAIDFGKTMASVGPPARSVNVPVDQIFSIKRYKSAKAKKRKRNLVAFGGIFLLTGITTAAHYFVVPDNKSSNRILVSSGIQLGASFLLFSLSAGSKEYKLKNTSPSGWWFK